MKKRKLGIVLLTLLMCVSPATMALAETTTTTTPPTTASGTSTGTGAADNLLGIERNPVEFAFEKAAENDSLLLEYDKTEGALRLTSKKNGSIWQSSVAEFPVDSLASGLVRNNMGSQVIAKYVDKAGNITAISSREDSVKKKSVTYSLIPNGFRAVYTFKKPGFVIPVEYTLDKDALQASVIVGEIEETNPAYRLYSVSVLPYFGTGSQQDTGYMLVPDGSGTLINFNNGKGRMTEYTQDIYGRDSAIALKAQEPVVQRAALPVFGIKKNEQAFVAVISDGDARARLHANVSGVTSQYNNVYTEFFYRNYDTVAVKEKNWDSKSVKVFEEVPANCKTFTVRYYPLTDDSADYTGMAQRYQRVLREEQNITATAESTPSLYVELYGSFKKTQYFLGIPYVAAVPLTTYSDTQAIAQALADGGLNNVVFQYQNWSSNSSDKNIPTGMKTASALGGTKAFKQMMSSLTGSGMQMYCDIDLISMTTSRWGYNQKWDGSKALQKSPAMQYSFHLGTYESDSTLPTTFLLRPAKMIKAALDTAKNTAKLGVTGLSADTLGQQLYSDFSTQKVDRTETQAIWQQALQTLRGAGDGLMLSSANAYALPSVTRITDVPTDSSHYLIADEAVPFYSLALHGLTSMSLSPVNYQASAQDTLLKALELGVGIQFTWTARNESKVTETAYDCLYNGHYTDWLEDAVSMQKTVESVLGGLGTQTIVEHKVLQDDVVRTTYAGGTSVYVNYTDSDVTADGYTVPAKGYYTAKK